jgi:hypothetical protein
LGRLGCQLDGPVVPVEETGLGRCSCLPDAAPGSKGDGDKRGRNSLGRTQLEPSGPAGQEISLVHKTE